MPRVRRARYADRTFGRIFHGSHRTAMQSLLRISYATAVSWNLESTTSTNNENQIMSPTPSIDSLMETLESISGNTFKAKRALALYDWVSDHTSELKNSTHDYPFGVLQELCLTDIFAALGRIYDWGEREPSGLNLALKQLRDCEIKEIDELVDFARWILPSAAQKLQGSVDISRDAV